jgi:hypothetical protein
MSNNEAKFLLGAYRSNGRDADNAMFAEALGQARNDPALGAWFARAPVRIASRRPAGGATSRSLPAITPSCAWARASRAPRKRLAFPPVWLALAASVAVLLTATVALWPNQADAESVRFTSFAMNDTAHGKHGGHGESAGALQALLGQPTTRLGAGLPVDFAKLRATGCRTLSFAGHDVLEVCFNRNGEWFHCYIANRADFPALPGAVAFVQQAQLASASWSDATNHFVVVSEAGMDAVKRLL